MGENNVFLRIKKSRRAAGKNTAKSTEQTAFKK